MTIRERRAENMLDGLSSLSDELRVMRAMLARAGYEPEDAEALHAEGMGTEELAERLRVPAGRPGSLTYTHKLRHVGASGREKNILHETEHLYLYRTAKRLEIRLQGATHAIVVGFPRDVESGKRVMARLEQYPHRLRSMMKGER